MDVDERNILAKPTSDGDGYTWTLASRLGEMLKEAEASYGERDRSYTLLGIEFTEDNARIWYPGNCKNIIIQLNLNALKDHRQACYQLAHETIHLISPSGGRKANILEEGLATHFSQTYTATIFNHPFYSTLHSYASACAAVRSLLGINPNAIKEMRQHEPSIWKMTPEIIQLVCPTIESSSAQILCQKFIR